MSVENQKVCFHCGLPAGADGVVDNNKVFCCSGCHTAYRLLSEMGMLAYYDFNSAPGIKQDRPDSVAAKYLDLDEQDVLCQICDFQNDRFGSVTLGVPQIHCTSCVWLLENLYRFHDGIRSSRVDYNQKTVSISFDRAKVQLSQIATTLDRLGYVPVVRNREESKSSVQGSLRKTLLLKIGVAGFCFGNVMLLSFPDYLLANGESLGEFEFLFAFLTFLLALPVLFFSASDFFVSSIRSLRVYRLNIDVPLAIGLLALFIRSVVDIFWFHKIGFMDSFTGLVFFLLLGRVFKEKTFSALNFERGYLSYFPLSLRRVLNQEERSVALSQIRIGDVLRLRHHEIIPADSVLQSDHAVVDYAFVTGESSPQPIAKGQLLYAGGRVLGKNLQLEIIKDVSQSLLTKLWNDAVFKTPKSQKFVLISDRVGQWFTAATLFLALLAGFYWQWFDASRVVPAVTSVLLIACPCALALAFPFTYGTAMRVLGRYGIYLKNMDVLETLQHVKHVVFDKTGTLTLVQKQKIPFVPMSQQTDLTTEDVNLVAALVSHSAHPLSVALFDSLQNLTTNKFEVENFKEVSGSGLSGNFLGKNIVLGNRAFVGGQDVFQSLPGEVVCENKSTQQDSDAVACHEDADKNELSSVVWLSINGICRGHFDFEQKYRAESANVVRQLSSAYAIHMISGDGAQDEVRLREQGLGQVSCDIHFKQSPEQKMQFIRSLSKTNELVAMVGDGLNDAGALQASDVGIAVTDDINAFSPASDVILTGSSFGLIPRLFEVATACRQVLMITIAVSLIYNFVGLGFAVTGRLSPLVSAILMPLSTLTVMLLSSQLTLWKMRKQGWIPSVSQNSFLPMTAKLSQGG